MEILSTIAGWWGAVVATLVAAYTIYAKWKDDSVRLAVTSFRERRSVLEVPINVTCIEIANIGKVPTTLKKVAVEDLSPTDGFVSVVDSHSFPLPFTLMPGSQWTGTADLDLTELAVTRFTKSVVIWVHHSHADKPIRVTFEPESRY